MESVTLRRAGADDVDWLVELLNEDDTEPFLAPHRLDRDRIAADVERSRQEPEAFGRLIIEVDGERAGVMGFERRSEVHRIAHLGGLAVHPDFRGRRIADEAARLLQRHLLFDLGYHRLELACYGFNDRAIRHAERVGFVREGVKRRAYLRHGEWQDAVEFGLLREDVA
ncbi:MAG TPA: GNAT family N-acetyltransferase [Gaiellaceae bacterium]